MKKEDIMNFLSLSEIIGCQPRPLDIFTSLFPEEYIREFYDSWNDGDYTESAKNKSIARLCITEHKNYAKTLNKLANCLLNIDNTYNIIIYIDSVLPESNKSTPFMQSIIGNYCDEICISLHDQSRFATTLKLLYSHINKPYCCAVMLYLIAVYMIFGDFYTKLEELYDITNLDTYNTIYKDLITGEDIIRYYNIYRCPVSVQPQFTNRYQVCGDSYNREFTYSSLLNKKCKEYWIMSLFANFCTNGEIHAQIEKRLEYDPDFSMRMILLHPNQFDYVSTMYTNVNVSNMHNYEVFEQWKIKFPEKFSLAYTNQPLSNRIYADMTNGKMLVDHLIVSSSTNYVLSDQLERNLPQDKSYFQKYISQFQFMWNEAIK